MTTMGPWTAPSLKLSATPLQVNRAWINQNWNAQQVCSSYWRFYWNHQDGAAIQWRDGLYHLTAHQVHLIPAWVWFDCHSDHRVDHFHIHFDIAGLPGVLVRQIFDHPFALDEHKTSQVLLSQISDSLWQTDQPSPVTWYRLQSLLCLTLAQAIEHLTPDQFNLCDQFLHASHVMSPILEYIEEHLGEPLSNQHLADLCHYSREHFLRCFKDCIGQTPAQYLRERRISRAAQQLMFDSNTIDYIAQQVGFTNRYHFSRVFRQVMGLSPAAYRNSKRV